jgi:integrase
MPPAAKQRRIGSESGAAGRYTAGTEFYLATGDIYATQQLLGHADVSTTANISDQGSPADLERKLDQVWGE